MPVKDSPIGDLGIPSDEVSIELIERVFLKSKRYFLKSELTESELMALERNPKKIGKILGLNLLGSKDLLEAAVYFSIYLNLVESEIFLGRKICTAMSLNFIESNLNGSALNIAKDNITSFKSIIINRLADLSWIECNEPHYFQKVKQDRSGRSPYLYNFLARKMYVRFLETGKSKSPKEYSLVDKRHPLIIGLVSDTFKSMLQFPPDYYKTGKSSLLDNAVRNLRRIKDPSV